MPGLYAAGDSCGTCFIGASYSGFGFATMHAAATGARAGLGRRQGGQTPDGRRAAPASTSGSSPRRPRACSSRWSARAASRPHWVTQVLQNTLAPYFVLYIKDGDRLQTALSTVEYLRDHIVPKLYARDDHELRLAHETKNMVTSAEMKLRSSLFRTESRGTHYREDYPGPQRRRVAGLGAAQGGGRPDEDVQGAHPGRVAPGRREAVRGAVPDAVAQRVARRRHRPCRGERRARRREEGR